MCTSATVCTSCNAPNFLNGNACLTSCPSGFTEDGTLNQCLVCNKYVLNKIDCISMCPVGYGLDDAQKTCLLCPSLCDSCPTLTQCSLCEKGSFLFEGGCLGQCPSGYFEDNTTSQCQTCANFSY